MSATAVLTQAWGTYQHAVAGWEADGQVGERPCLVLPLDHAARDWPGLQAARDSYRAALQRVEAHLATLDVFDKPSLQRADIRRADAAIQAAFRAHDHAALTVALGRWERAITRGQDG